MPEGWGTTARVLGGGGADFACVCVGRGWIALADDGGGGKEERCDDNAMVAQRAHRAKKRVMVTWKGMDKVECDVELGP